MTENEAKRKLCPMSSPGRDETEGRRLPYCVSSACMAWAWLNRPTQTGDKTPRSGTCGMVLHRGEWNG